MLNRIFTALFFSVLLLGCKKVDYLSVANNQSQQATQAAVDRFFVLPDNAGIDLKEIVKHLKKMETQHPFLASYIAENGTPDWKYAISGRNLFTAGVSRVSTSSESQNYNAPVYFIPLVDSNSKEVKSFLFCAQSGDSSYRYRLYNKNRILQETPKNIKSLLNGTTILSVFATFEKTINSKNETTYGYPWKGTYKNAFIKFEPSHSSVVATNSIKTSAQKRSSQQQQVNSDCWIARTQTVTFGSEEYGTVSFQMAWWENICTGEVELIGFFPIGGGGSGSSGGSGGGTGGTGSGGGFGGFGSGGGGYGYDPGGGFVYDPGMGGGSGSGGGGGTYNDPFNPPGSINDPIFQVPIPGNQEPVGTISPLFYNQFMTPTEGQDGDPYDSNYWDDPNLTMPAQTLPSWASFQSAYPGHKDPLYDDPSKMYSSVGGNVLALYNTDPSKFQNTCALRVSKALNYSGVTIPPGPGRFQGADGKYYFLGASTLAKWLKLTFGTPTGTNHITSTQGGAGGLNLPGLVSGKKGIYVMIPKSPSIFGASGHVDIINNGMCDGGCYFGDDVFEIFIWELF